MFCLLSVFLLPLAGAQEPTDPQEEAPQHNARGWEQVRCEGLQGLFETRAELHDVRLELSAAASQPKAPAGDLRYSDVAAAATDGARLTELIELEGFYTLQVQEAEVAHIKLTSTRISSSHTLAWCRTQTWDDAE